MYRSELVRIAQNNISVEDMDIFLSENEFLADYFGDVKAPFPGPLTVLQKDKFLVDLIKLLFEDDDIY